MFDINLKMVMNACVFNMQLTIC